jgi:hypothetical protein
MGNDAGRIRCTECETGMTIAVYGSGTIDASRKGKSSIDYNKTLLADGFMDEFTISSITFDFKECLKNFLMIQIYYSLSAKYI